MSTNQAEYYRGLEVAGDALRGDRDSPPATQAERVHEAIEPLLAQTEVHKQLACRLGCSHCCHFPVGVTYPEAMRLAAAVRTRTGLVARIENAAQSLCDRDWEQLVGTPCPLLIDDVCAAHDARPMPCRALGSLDADACAEALTSDRTPPRDEEAWWRGLGAASALAAAGASGTRELRSAVAALLTASEGTSEAAFLAARAAPGS